MDVFKCEFCEFTANLEGELKTHLRSKHNNKINQFDWKLCEFCNFNCKSNSEMGTHMKQFDVTHSRRNRNHHMQQVHKEISEMSKQGFILRTFQTAENQKKYLSQDNQCDYYSGKGPR